MDIELPKAVGLWGINELWNICKWFTKIVGKTTQKNKKESEEIMTELNEEHFELHDQNKAERYERQKLTFLEDRIKVLEKSIESIHKILGRYQMKEGE